MDRTQEYATLWGRLTAKAARPFHLTQRDWAQYVIGNGTDSFVIASIQGVGCEFRVIQYPDGDALLAVIGAGPAHARTVWGLVFENGIQTDKARGMMAAGYVKDAAQLAAYQVETEFNDAEAEAAVVAQEVARGDF